MMRDSYLICIPDISGFTQFVSHSGIEMSADVITSLLNKVIYTNELNLKVSEIEGDAVLFYRKGVLPSFKELVDQCKLFYTEFYKQLRFLELKHRKKEDVDNIPEMLGLKIILHFGNDIKIVPIGKNIKLMGEDIIIAHRLLKNSIPMDEYILFSKELLNFYKSPEINEEMGWANLKSYTEYYPHIGEVPFSYIDLTPLSDTESH